MFSSMARGEEQAMVPSSASPDANDVLQSERIFPKRNSVAMSSGVPTY